MINRDKRLNKTGEGSFAGKGVTPTPRGRITRLGAHGGARQPYGSFNDKLAFVPVDLTPETRCDTDGASAGVFLLDRPTGARLQLGALLTERRITNLYWSEMSDLVFTEDDLDDE